MAASSSDFADVPLGHAFVLRKPLARVGARRCASCGADVFEHHRSEVNDEFLLMILNVTGDDRPTEILPGEISVGGFKAALAECRRNPQAVAVNCAGTRLHSFLPATRQPFDALRSDGRVLDLEWEDAEDFELPLVDMTKAIAWIHAQISAGHPVVINCAQGKSRSGALATAFVMGTQNLSAEAALAVVKARRPFVQPNPAFMRRLHALEKELRELGPQTGTKPKGGEASVEFGHHGGTIVRDPRRAAERESLDGGP